MLTLYATHLTELSVCVCVCVCVSRTGATFDIEPRLWGCTRITSTRVLWSRVKDAICDELWDTRCVCVCLCVCLYECHVIRGRQSKVAKALV